MAKALCPPQELVETHPEGVVSAIVIYIVIVYKYVLAFYDGVQFFILGLSVSVWKHVNYITIKDIGF